jgi:hypothetical protein
VPAFAHGGEEEEEDMERERILSVNDASRYLD